MDRPVSLPGLPAWAPLLTQQVPHLQGVQRNGCLSRHLPLPYSLHPELLLKMRSGKRVGVPLEPTITRVPWLRACLWPLCLQQGLSRAICSALGMIY